MSHLFRISLLFVFVAALAAGCYSNPAPKTSAEMPKGGPQGGAQGGQVAPKINP
jgi:hypothetical protein